MSISSRAAGPVTGVVVVKDREEAADASRSARHRRASRGFGRGGRALRRRVGAMAGASAGSEETHPKWRTWNGPQQPFTAIRHQRAPNT